MWVEDLKCMHCFLGCKKIISRWMLYLILCRLKMGCVTFMSTQHDSFIKRVKWVWSSQPALLTGRVRVGGS